ncbi:hypothetical protein YPPY99_4135, partial [Yersinia pestis PY-99]
MGMHGYSSRFAF